MKSILLLVIVSTSLLAQPPLPPMPPVPPGIVLIQPSNAVPINVVVPPLPNPGRTPAFTFTCPYCKMKQIHIRALAVVTNGFHTVVGGNVVERTAHLVCHNADCQKQCAAKADKFIAEVIATEESE